MRVLFTHQILLHVYFVKKSGYIEILYTVIPAVRMCCCYSLLKTAFMSPKTCTVATCVQYSYVVLHITCLLASKVNFLE